MKNEMYHLPVWNSADRKAILRQIDTTEMPEHVANVAYDGYLSYIYEQDGKLFAVNINNETIPFEMEKDTAVYEASVGKEVPLKKLSEASIPDALKEHYQIGLMKHIWYDAEGFLYFTGKDGVIYYTDLAQLPHRSLQEIEALKQDWLRDSIFDLYPTPEGFERYEAELKDFQERQIAIWEKKREAEREARLNAAKKPMEEMGLLWPSQYSIYWTLTDLQDKVAKHDWILKEVGFRLKQLGVTTDVEF